MPMRDVEYRDSHQATASSAARPHGQLIPNHSPWAKQTFFLCGGFGQMACSLHAVSSTQRFPFFFGFVFFFGFFMSFCFFFDDGFRFRFGSGLN